METISINLLRVHFQLTKSFSSYAFRFMFVRQQWKVCWMNIYKMMDELLGKIQIANLLYIVHICVYKWWHCKTTPKQLGSSIQFVKNILMLQAHCLYVWNCVGSKRARSSSNCEKDIVSTEFLMKSHKFKSQILGNSIGKFVLFIIIISSKLLSGCATRGHNVNIISNKCYLDMYWPIECQFK